MGRRYFVKSTLKTGAEGASQMLVVDETIRYLYRRKGIDPSPVISALQGAMDAITCAEMRRFRSKLGSLSPEQKEAVQIVLHGIADKLLQPAIRTLNEAAKHGDSERIATVCTLFDLPPMSLLDTSIDRSSSSAVNRLGLLMA